MSFSILVLFLLAGTTWAFVPDDPEFGGTPSIGYPNDISHFTRNAFVTSSESPYQIAREFLARMTQAIKSKNVAVISELFVPEFEFRECGHYIKKEEFIGMLSSMPADFSFILKEAYYAGEPMGELYGFRIRAPGISQYSNEVEFSLYNREQKLFRGQARNCQQKQRFVSFSHSDDSKAIVSKFLESMKQILSSRNAALIGKVFDYGFLYNGCHATYTKAQIVAMITAFPANAPIDFSLVDSKWNNRGQIEYNVYVSVPRMESFKAHFVYCPQRNVIKSGSVNGCPIKGFTVY
ncbi:unnamed protein product [Caenorhabditis nigoni]